MVAGTVGGGPSEGSRSVAAAGVGRAPGGTWSPSCWLHKGGGGPAAGVDWFGS